MSGISFIYVLPGGLWFWWFVSFFSCHWRYCLPLSISLLDFLSHTHTHTHRHTHTHKHTSATILASLFTQTNKAIHHNVWASLCAQTHTHTHTHTSSHTCV